MTRSSTRRLRCRVAPPSPAAGGLPGPRNDLTDVAGVRVGHHQRIGRGWRTGTTVVLPAPLHRRGRSAGRRPGHERDRRARPPQPRPHADAVCLTGGSAYGLAAADGVMAWLEEHGMGFPVGPDPGQVVPSCRRRSCSTSAAAGRFDHRPGPVLRVRGDRPRRPGSSARRGRGGQRRRCGRRRGRSAGRRHRVGQPCARGRHDRGRTRSPSTPPDGSTTLRPVSSTARRRSSTRTPPWAGRSGRRCSRRPSGGRGRRPRRRSTPRSASWPPTPHSTARRRSACRGGPQRAGSGRAPLAPPQRRRHLLRPRHGERPLPAEVGSVERTHALNGLAAAARGRGDQGDRARRPRRPLLPGPAVLPRPVPVVLPESGPPSITCASSLVRRHVR
jgi:hypothetical protein